MPRKISVEIVGDSRSLERAFDRSAKSARGFNRSVSQAGRSRRAFGGLTRSVTGLAGSFLGAYGLTSAVHAAFSEMAESQKVAAQTKAGLKSTGGIANVTAKHVDELAKSLLHLSGVDDEVIHQGENVLLTFTKVRNEVGKNNDVFDQATKAALDISVRMGTDMPHAALQLGKALQDPIKGIGALRRIGIQFTDDQEKQIKRLVETGHTLDAQKIILREVNREFGHSAEMAGRTLPGKWNILRESAKNLGGEIAQTLAPSITRLLDSANKWISNSKNQKQVLDTVKAAAGAVKDILVLLKGAMETLNRITGSTKNSLKLLFGVLVAYKGLKLVASLARIADGIGLIGTRAGTSTGKVRGLTGVLKRLSGVPLAGPLGLALAGTAAAYAAQPYVTKGLNKVFKKVGLRHDPSPASVSRPVFRHGRLVWSGSGMPYVHGQPRDPRPAVFTGDIHVHGVQNVHQLAREIDRKKRRGAVSRTGPRAGQRGD